MDCKICRAPGICICEPALLSEPPAALAPPYAEMAELVETAEQARLYARRLKGELRTKEQKQVEAFADAIISAGRRAEFEMARVAQLEAALTELKLASKATSASTSTEWFWRVLRKHDAALSTEAKAQGGEHE